jgi:hypothetical protein
VQLGEGEGRELVNPAEVLKEKVNLSGKSMTDKLHSTFVAMKAQQISRHHNDQRCKCILKTTNQ